MLNPPNLLKKTFLDEQVPGFTCSTMIFDGKKIVFEVMARPAIDLVALVEGQERFEAATAVVVAGTLAEST